MAETRNNLGSALWRRGDYARAERELREALRLRPGYAEAYFNLGHVAMRTGDAAAAGRQFRQAAAARPDWALAQTTAAWVLATAADAEARAPGGCRRHRPTRAVTLTGRRDAQALDVLAVSLAAAGRFDEAVRSRSRGARAGRAAAQGGHRRAPGAVRTRRGLRRSPLAFGAVSRASVS